MDWCPTSRKPLTALVMPLSILDVIPTTIANSRILSISDNRVTFSAIGKKPGEPRRQITLDYTEFIRRYLMHVLPSSFQKIITVK